MYISALKNTVKTETDSKINQGSSIKINHHDERKEGGDKSGKKCC